jgi:hypothetical protein
LHQEPTGFQRVALYDQPACLCGAPCARLDAGPHSELVNDGSGPLVFTWDAMALRFEKVHVDCPAGSRFPAGQTARKAVVAPAPPGRYRIVFALPATALTFPSPSPCEAWKAHETCSGSRYACAEFTLGTEDVDVEVVLPIT